MPQVINTNISSLNAQRNLNNSQTALATSLQRLSSGLRINSAKDDAAGLAISDRMTSQIRGLNQAGRNANDGISLAQTAESGLAAVGDSLQRLRELSVQSANATNTLSDRASLNAEAQTLLAEIQRVATTTQFNGQNILDGTFSAAQFQVGANANQTITATTGNAQTTSIGAYQYNNTTAVNGNALSAGDLTINGVDVGLSASGSADDIVNTINSVTGQTAVTATATSSLVAANTPTAKQDLSTGDLVINGTNIGAVTGSYNMATQGANIAAAINLKTNATGVTATADKSTGAISLASSTGKTIALTSNNGTAGASRVENASGLELSASTATGRGTVAITATAGSQATTFTVGAGLQDKTFTVGTGAKQKTYQFVDSASTAGALGANNIAINFDSAGTQADFSLAIKTAVEANNTSVTVTGATSAVTFTSEALGILNVKDYNVGGSTAAGNGLTLGADTAATGITEGGTVVIEGTTYTFADSATTNTVTGVSSGTIGMRFASQNNIATNLSNAVNNAQASNTTDNTATVATNTVTFATTLKGTAGNLATLATGTAVGAGVVAAQSVTATDGAYTAANAFGIISLSSNAAFTVAGANPGKAGLASAASSFNTLSTVDISTVTGANSAISLIDGALSQVATIRGSMGALQNRFASVVSSLSASSENLSAARSRIQDADFASETAQLTRNQILQQAGVAMLAQANSLPQSVLSLLQG